MNADLNRFRGILRSLVYKGEEGIAGAGWGWLSDIPDIKERTGLKVVLCGLILAELLGFYFVG